MKRIAALITALCMVFALPVTAAAESNYEEYVYNTDGESVPAPETYSPVAILYGNEQTDLPFAAPQDIAFDKSDNLYVLDSGNDRIVVYDTALALKQIITPPSVDGTAMSFIGAAGLFLTDNELYVTDKENGLIYVLDHNGNGIRIITFKPQAVVDEKFIFKPCRITVDDAGIIQVQAEGCYNGLITLDGEGNMIGYFSANTIQASLSVIAAQFWRKIFSDEQQDDLKQIIPVEYSSVAMDSEGFVYTTTAKTENSTFEIKKLNPYGNNILGYDDSSDSLKIGNGDYGDLRKYYTDGHNVDTTFEDIYVDNEGFIFALDTTRGRVFQYDQKSNLISVFGGIGFQKGTFALPSAVSGLGEKIYVLDETKNCLTVFEPNDYVRNIRTALLLDEKCDYLQAAEYWQKVYEANANYTLALSGLGKVAYENGDLKGAMDYFKRADDRTNYDIVYNAYRTAFIRNNFVWFGMAVIGIAAAMVTLVIFKKRKGR